MADVLGSDLSATTGLDSSLALFSGTRIVAEAALRRITTQRGSLFYARSYGIDVRELLNAKIDATLLGSWRARIENEIANDDRVDSVAARLVFDPGSGTLTVSVSGTTGTGPFRFTLAVSDISIDILEVG